MCSQLLPDKILSFDLPIQVSACSLRCLYRMLSIRHGDSTQDTGGRNVNIGLINQNRISVLIANISSLLLSSPWPYQVAVHKVASWAGLSDLLYYWPAQKLESLIQPPPVPSLSQHQPNIPSSRSYPLLRLFTTSVDHDLRAR